MIGVVQALDAARGITDRGFTFVGARGPGEDLTLSFDQLRLEALRRASHLRTMGLVKGDRLALVIPEGEDFIPTFLAALWLGVVPVPLYPPVSLGKLDAFMDALVGILNVARPKALVTSERVGKVLWSADGKVTTLERVVLTSELRADVPLIDPPPHPADEDIAFLQFTSGSTSAPKGVMVTHGNLISNSKAILHDGLQWRPGDVTVSWLPLYHDMGLIGCLLLAIYHPGPLALLPPEAFLARPALWLRAIGRTRATLTVAPNFAFGLCAKRVRDEELEGVDLSCLRLSLNGAEPIAPAAFRRFCERFARFGFDPRTLMPVYGLSEASLAVTFSPPGRGPRTVRSGGRELASVGPPVAGVEVSIRGEDGGELSDGAIGRIHVRGPSVMGGYFQDAGATAQALRDGWLDTGDLGFVEGGELVVSGRAKEVIVLRGANHAPQEFEDALDGLAGARPGCAAAVGLVPEGADGEELALLVEVEREGVLAADAVRARVVERTGIRPHTVELLLPGTLPRTSSGKLRRAEALRQYLDGDLRPPRKVTLLRMAREAALSAAALARLRFSR